VPSARAVSLARVAQPKEGTLARVLAQFSGGRGRKDVGIVRHSNGASTQSTQQEQQQGGGGVSRVADGHAQGQADNTGSSNGIANAEMGGDGYESEDGVDRGGSDPLAAASEALRAYLTSCTRCVCVLLWPCSCARSVMM